MRHRRGGRRLGQRWNERHRRRRHLYRNARCGSTQTKRHWRDRLSRAGRGRPNDHAPIDTDTYSSVISVGAFTHGHLGPSAIDELLRVGAPGARYALGINSDHFKEMGYRDWFATAETDARIVALPFAERPVYTSGDDEHAGTVCQVALFRLPTG
jgi:hypothetical protein